MEVTRKVVNQNRAYSLLAADNTFASTLLIWAIDAFGYDDQGPYVCRWHPETVALECESKLGRKLPPANFDRLMAAITIVTTDLFQQDVQAFVHLANVLCGSEVPPGAWDPAEPDECAWAVTEATLLDPPENGQNQFGSDVVAYIAATLKEYGVLKPPRALAFVGAVDLSSTGFDVSGDPEFASALMEEQYAKTEEIDAGVGNSLRALIEQIEQLHLETASLKEFRQRAHAELTQVAAALSR